LFNSSQHNRSAPTRTSLTTRQPAPYAPSPADDHPTAPFADARARSARLEAELLDAPGSHRVLTGDRPTGPLHLGHYFGTLQNRVRLQNLGLELLVLIADYQTITDQDSPASLPADVDGLIADYLAVRIDPTRATIFTHSQVAPLNQLMLPFLSLISVAELARNPTVKEERALSGQATSSGQVVFTYPVRQAADILSCKATVVPVGKHQLPHVELTRLIARRFQRYSPTGPCFPEPQALLSDATLLLGTDGHKMGKSRRNAIPLSATEDETARLVEPRRPTRIVTSPTTRPRAPKSRTSSYSPLSARTATPTTSPRRSAQAPAPPSSAS
jgi:tryptophanyl-tRNA synthetase